MVSHKAVKEFLPLEANLKIDEKTIYKALEEFIKLTSVKIRGKNLLEIYLSLRASSGALFVYC